MTRPTPVLGMRRRHRIDGSPFLVSVLDEDLLLVAGTELHLVRIAADEADGPSHALRVLPPQVAPSAAERRRAAAGRLDGSAIRADARDGYVHRGRRGGAPDPRSSD